MQTETEETPQQIIAQPMEAVEAPGLHQRSVDLSDGLQAEERAVAGLGVIASEADGADWERIDETVLTREEMDFVGDFIHLRSGGRKKVVEKLADKGALAYETVFAEFGLGESDTESVLEAWDSLSHSACSEEERSEYVTQNLLVLKELRSMDPTYPAELIGRFGIRHFGRYPASVLAAQVELLRTGDVSRPVVVVMESTEDYNNSSFAEGYRPVDVYGALEDSGDLHVVYAEAAATQEVVSHVRTIRQAAGRPVSALFITGHGSKNAMQVGNSVIRRNKYDSFQQLEHLYSQGLLTPAAETILVACSVGTRGGLAETFSDRFKRHIIAAPAKILLNPLERLQEGVYSLSYIAASGIRRLFTEYDTGGIRYTKHGGVHDYSERDSQAVRIND